MGQAKVIYGVMERSAAEVLLRDSGSLPVQNAQLETAGAVAAITGTPSPMRFKPKARQNAARRAEYLRMLERMMEEGVVLPVPRAFEAPSKRVLKGQLRRHEARLTDLLSRFHGLSEVAVKVEWNVSQFVRETLTTFAPDVSAEGKNLRPRTAEGLQEEILMEQLRQRQSLIDALAPHIVDRLVDRPGTIDEALSARFLIHRDQEQAFYDSLTAPAIGARGLKARFFGPLPARSFINLASLLNPESQTRPNTGFDLAGHPEALSPLPRTATRPALAA